MEPQQQLDLEGYITNLNYQDTTTKLYAEPALILRGFVRRADGIGSHLPNMFDNIFCEYKDVSFATPSDRRHYMHGFLHDLPDTHVATMERYKHDLLWVAKYRAKENKHIETPDPFIGSKLINLGGFCGPLQQEYANNFLDFFKFKKQYKSTLYLYLMWESADMTQLEPFMTLYDHIIVTNTWLQQQLQQTYPTQSVLLIEHFTKYYKIQAQGSQDKFIFGFSGGLWERKKVDVILKAFNKARQSNDLLKIHSRKHANTEPMLQTFDKVFQPNKAQVEFQNQTLTDADFAQWWSTLNCYIFISAGEAYSITPRQALMQGTPVILSKNTSHLDLLDVPGILWVECEAKPTAKYSGNADADQVRGIQFEPKMDSVIDCMHQVKDKYAYWKAEAIKGGAILEKRTAVATIKNQWRQLLTNE